MNRRELLKRSAALGLTATGSLALPGAAAATSNAAQESAPPSPLTPPANASIPVAFLISEGAVVIDFCGPWEIFERVNIPGRKYDAFHLYTVAETAAPITAAGGLKIVPNYTIANAPAPKIIVIPAQSPASEATKVWIRNATKSTDVTMSVCTGAFVLASTGLLSGKSATTHHGAYVDLAIQYPDIHVQRGARFVESGNLASAGGLTSGMDLAMRVVERYFSRDVANQSMPDLSSSRQIILYAPSAAWKSNGLSPPLIRERHTTSVCKSTNKSSIPHQKSSPQYDRYPRGKSMERPAPFPR